MRFELNEALIEEEFRSSDLASRVIAKLPAGVPVRYMTDGRAATRPSPGAGDPFGEGKRRLAIVRRRAPFLMGCPAGSREFACCGYLVLVLASNCPMDCSYCFLQEYVADNPAFQIYANYADAFAELDRLTRADNMGRALRIGSGELADSLAFDSITGISRDLVEYFARRENLLLELKTKTDEIDNLLTIDPRGRTLVSWTLSPPRVFASSEHRTASPQARIAAARRVFDAGYKVGFHLDPIIIHDDAEHDYVDLLDRLFDSLKPDAISFISMGGLRMTPKLRAAARTRFPSDPMLVGEDVLSPDGRWRAFAPARLRMFSRLREHIVRAAPKVPIYLCMESPTAHRRVFGVEPETPAAMGSRLAGA